MKPHEGAAFPILSRTVGVGARGWGSAGSGTLLVYPGKLVLHLSRFARRLAGVTQLVHTDPDITLIKARLMFPWANTTVVLKSESGGHIVTGTIPCNGRRGLRRALQQAGFMLNEERTWFSIGSHRTR